MEAFSPAVSEKIGNYVYRLIDPRNGQTFYVGKGQGNRVFDHARGNGPESNSIETDDSDQQPLKLNVIREIRNAQLEVIHVIHRHAIPADAVRHVEAALIDAYAGLSNIQGGYQSNSVGPMNVSQIEDFYALPILPTDISEKLILININGIADWSNAQSILARVSGNWRLNVARASKADYILAIRSGVCIGVFIADSWHPYENLNEPNRHYFKGTVAEPNTWERFVGSRGKRIADEEMKHIQNPIRYYNM